MKNTNTVEQNRYKTKLLNAKGQTLIEVITLNEDVVPIFWEYNEKGQLIEKIYETYSQYFEYDKHGHMVKQILDSGHFDTFEYDDNGQMVKKTYWNGDYDTYEYNEKGQLVRKITAVAVGVEYDEFKNEYYEYDEEGYKVSDRNMNDYGEFTFEYDDEGNIVKETFSQSQVTTTKFDWKNGMVKTFNTRTKKYETQTFDWYNYHNDHIRKPLKVKS